MGFIFFILALVFFILWLTAKSKNTEGDTISYEKGYNAASRDIIQSLKEKLHDGPITKKVLSEYEGEESAAVSSASPAAVSTGAIAFPGERREEDDELEETPALQPVVNTAYEKPVPTLTKAEQTNRNLNVLLYTASFLIIAAAAAFVATSMPASVRLAGVWAVTAAFYGVGLLLHARVPYLRSAATAFVGTGLALIPFAGIALSQLGGLSEGWSWAVTSLIGLLCYAIATIRLNSNIVAYLTIAFSLSLAASTVAVVSGPMVLYFVALIVVSLVFHIAAHLKFAWIPKLFRQPIEQTGHLLTPLTLAASLLAFDSMTAASYQIVFWVATLYYLVIWLTDKQYVYELAVRILGSVAFLITALDFVQYNLTQGLWIWLCVLAIQGLYSVARVTSAGQERKLAETVWYWAVLGLALTTLPYWVGTDTAHAGVTAQVIVVGGLSILMALRLRSLYSALPALFASVALPFVIGRWPGEELMSVQATTLTLLAMAAMALAVYGAAGNRSEAVRGFLRGAFWLYIVIAFCLSFGQGSNLAFALSSTITAFLVLQASYLYRMWPLESIAAILTPVIVTLLVMETQVSSVWVAILAITITSALYVAGALLHHLRQEKNRRDVLVVATLIVGLGLVFGSIYESELVQIISVGLAVLYTGAAFMARIRTSGLYVTKALAAGYIAYPVVALVSAIGLGAEWYTLLFAFITVMYWVASYVEKTALFVAFANFTLAAALTSGWLWLGLDSEWMVVGVSWVAALFYLVTYLLFIHKIKDADRALVQLVFTWVALAVPAFIYFWTSSDKGYAGAVSVLLGAGVMILHGISTAKKGLAEAGIYVLTIALQRLVGLALPETNILLYGHWWAAILVLVAYWRREDGGLRTRFIVAVAAITLSSGIMALAEGGYYQLIFLIEHVILLVIGALSRTSWALWWGLVATVLAVLYFLKSSLFLSLLFLGLTLLGIVIWRLIKAQKK